MAVSSAARRGSWYRIKNLASSGADIHIYDEVGQFGVTAQDFLADLAQVDGPVALHLNSPGGEIFDGIAIYNALKSRNDVSVQIEGLAASIASVIAMAASPGKLGIAKRATMMIHDGFSQVTGNAAEMRELAELLDKQSDNIAGIYSDRTGRPAAEWRDKMRGESWYTGQEAVDAGLADYVTGSEATVNAKWDLSGFKHVPGTLAAQITSQLCARCGGELRNEMGSGQPQEVGDGWMRDPDGSYRFDPDGDGDDDATPEGDTDHDYFDADGNQIQEIPPNPALKKSNKAKKAKIKAKKAELLNANVDNSPWDASKAWSAGADSDDPAAFYKGICAGRKAGDPDLQSSWALPYKYTPSSPPNAAAVRNALARISQTQGLTNKAEAQSLLERLMKQVNPDYEANLIDPGLLQALFSDALKGVNYPDVKAPHPVHL